MFDPFFFTSLETFFGVTVEAPSCFYRTACVFSIPPSSFRPLSICRLTSALYVPPPVPPREKFPTAFPSFSNVFPFKSVHRFVPMRPLIRLCKTHPASLLAFADSGKSRSILSLPPLWRPRGSPPLRFFLKLARGILLAFTPSSLCADGVACPDVEKQSRGDL